MDKPQRKHAFLWIFIITIVTLISSVVIHEIGHVTLGYASGCVADRIIFEVDSANIYTKVSCPEALKTVVILGGLIMGLGFSMLFLTIKDLPEGDLFFIISGINLIISYKDLVLINNTIAYASFISGFVILLLGEIIYSSAYMQLDSRILGPLTKFRIYREELQQ